MAKEHAWEVVSAYPSDRVGLVVFGGSAFLQMPFTSDRASLRLFLDSASPDDLGDPATDISAALLTAVSAFEHEGEEGRRAVLIASDGESGEGDLKAAIEALRDEDLPVFAIGVGTTRGGPVPADSSEAPEPYHRDHLGRVIVSRLEEDELKTVAAATGGAYARGDRAGGAAGAGGGARPGAAAGPRCEEDEGAGGSVPVAAGIDGRAAGVGRAVIPSAARDLARPNKTPRCARDDRPVPPLLLPRTPR